MQREAAEISHVIFIDIVAWSTMPTERQAETIRLLTDSVTATAAYRQANESGNLITVPSGDGMALVFLGELTAPVRCALEIAVDFPIRIGIHSGPIQRQVDVSGKVNVVGDGINLAKRVQDMASPGEIWLSEIHALWLRQFSEWSDRIEALGEKTAKHGVAINAYRLIPPPKPKQDGKRLCLLYKRRAQPDEVLLGELEKQLSAAGHQVFVDRHLGIGVEWARRIEEMIRAADAVIVLASDAAAESEMLEAEVEIARTANVKILPVRVASEEPIGGSLGQSLGKLQFAAWMGSPDTETVIQKISAALTNPAPVTTIEPDTGGVIFGSRLYIERPSDAQFFDCIQRSESILLVKGPRQVGKTSLLAQATGRIQSLGYRQAFTDFQKLSGRMMADEETFYRALAAYIGKQIGFKYDFQNEWDPIFGAGLNLESFLRAALEDAETPLVWIIDEADKLFTAPFASDFYGLVRSWHNSRATDPTGPWHRLTVVIAYATEAHLFIQDLNQSPFNVGRKFELVEFTFEDVDRLNALTGANIGSDGLRALYGLIGGQPFLVRRALNTICSGMSVETLLDQSWREDGPFGDHLKRILVSVSTMEGVLDFLRSVLNGEPTRENDAHYRLQAAGITKLSSTGGLVARNELYRRYLSERILNHG